MINYTPGPWRVDKRARCRIVAGDDDTIASAARQSSLVDQHQANAALIAEAPAMYEALKRISKAISDGLDHSRDVAVLERCIKLAKAAVAKVQDAG